MTTMRLGPLALLTLIATGAAAAPAPDSYEFKLPLVASATPEQLQPLLAPDFAAHPKPRTKTYTLHYHDHDHALRAAGYTLRRRQKGKKVKWTLKRRRPAPPEARTGPFADAAYEIDVLPTRETHSLALDAKSKAHTPPGPLVDALSALGLPTQTAVVCGELRLIRHVVAANRFGDTLRKKKGPKPGEVRFEVLRKGDQTLAVEVSFKARRDVEAARQVMAALRARLAAAGLLAKAPQTKTALVYACRSS